MCNSKVLLFVILFSVCCILPTILFGQVDTAWVRRYNGPGNGGDGASAIAIDNLGNIYITGSSTSPDTSSDYATIKYNSNGVVQWVVRYNGPGNSYDWASAIAVDNAGNVYVTGSSCGSDSSYDYTTIKYNSNGVEQWVARYNGPQNNADWAYSLVVDGQSNVYVIGKSYGSGTYYDYATVKYNSNGVEQWVARYNGPGNNADEGYAIMVDTLGNVYVIGGSYGVGTYYDYATIKYNSTGVEQWVARYNGPGNNRDMAYSIVLDRQSNVYVTGYSSGGSSTLYDYATIKYNSAGVEQWVARYNGPGTGNSDDEAYSLVVDGQSNVYVIGKSYGSGTYYDYATVKYNSNGVEQWVARYNGLGNGNDEVNSLAVDGQSNVYVTGYSSGGSSTLYDYVTIKYNSAGVQQWVVRYNGPGNDWDVARAIAVDNSSNVYVTGYSIGLGTSEDYTTIKYVQTQGVEEIEIATPSARNDFVIYPNPAKSFFVVRGPLSVDNPTIKLYDVTGKVITEVKLRMGSLTSLSQRISLDGIKNGIYFVKVNDEMVKEKLVVTK